MSVLALNSENFEKNVLEEKGLLVIDFHTDWCGPCKLIAPIIEILSQEYEGRVKFFEFNADNTPANHKFATGKNILSVPQLWFFMNGVKIKEIIGAQNITTYRSVIDEILAGKKEPEIKKESLFSRLFQKIRCLLD
jgi:thioredoxin 1